MTRMFCLLTGHPKLFFIQSCSGEEVVKAAGGPRAAFSFNDQADGDDEAEADFFYQPTLPVDADLFVASATTLCTYTCFYAQ